jgi:cell division protein FtsB
LNLTTENLSKLVETTIRLFSDMSLPSSASMNGINGSATQADIQEKISAARREADGLKDKIRMKKDQTADTSRE